MAVSAAEAADGLEGWIVGGEGVWTGRPGERWQRHGGHAYDVQDVDRAGRSLWVATGNGLWSCPAQPGARWVQWHDETLTEVLSVRHVEGGLPRAAGSYGVALCRLDEAGLPRWTSQTEGRSPDERYTNVLRAGADGVWLAGTEAGVLATADDGAGWEPTTLSGSPVRCLERLDGRWWAGTDDRGLFSSDDGRRWEAVPGSPPSAFHVALDGERLLVGGYDGIHQRDASGAWTRSGPQALIRGLAVHEGVWVAAADPGGLWWSRDEGASWRRTGDFDRVHVIRPPRTDEAGGAA